MTADQPSATSPSLLSQDVLWEQLEQLAPQLFCVRTIPPSGWIWMTFIIDLAGGTVTRRNGYIKSPFPLGDTIHPLLPEERSKIVARILAGEYSVSVSPSDQNAG